MLILKFITTVVYKLFKYSSSMTNYLETLYAKLLNQQIKNINKRNNNE